MNFLFSSSKDNSVRLHNISSKTTLLTLLLPASISSVVVDSEQRSVFAACSNGNVYQIDLHKALRPMNTTGSTFATSMNALSTPSTTMPGHSQSVLSVKLSFDGSLLASASLDGTIRIWDTTTLTCIRTLSRTNRLSFNSLVTVRLPCVQSTRKRVEERGIIRGKTTQKRDLITVGGCDERIGTPMPIGESQRFENVMDDVKNEWSNLFCKANPKNSSTIPTVLNNDTTLQQWQEAALQLYNTSLQHIVQHSAESK
jgi:WD40 repeat protein